MGIYDRDYYREEQRPSLTMRGPRTVVGALILLNVVVYLADGLLTKLPVGSPPGACGDIAHALGLKTDSLTKPWMWWQFLTYGFAHASYPMLWHIAGNMLALFFLGPSIERTYGPKEFLRLYMAMVIVGGLAWAIVEKMQGQPAVAVGASAAVAGTVILFALNFPRQTLLLFFVIPMPAWVVGLLIVIIDVLGALGAESSRVAFTAHLGGAAFAFLYFQSGWNLTRWTSGWGWLARLKGRPRLRVHRPDREEEADSELSDEVDRILAKIHRQGEGSLTRKERRILESASRQYQKRRQGPDDQSP